jgi:Large ribosomal RNA subunit accumulation protein YceD
MSDPAAPGGLEFTRPVDIGRLPAGGAVYDLKATAAERDALARRFDLLALERLEAEVRLERLAGGLLRLSAALKAEVVQACVVTLEPLPDSIDEPFTVLYRAGAEAGDSTVVLSGAAELVEPLTGDILDIGEAVAQQLSLALDPYPRAPDAAAAAPAPRQASPFAPLAKWKEKN